MIKKGFSFVKFVNNANSTFAKILDRKVFSLVSFVDSSKFTFSKLIDNSFYVFGEIKKSTTKFFYSYNILVQGDSENLPDSVLGKYYFENEPADYVDIFVTKDASFLSEQNRTLSVQGVDYTIPTLTIEFDNGN